MERRPRAMAWKCRAVATSDLPDPVGVFRTTFFSSNNSRMADSWAG